APAALRLLSDMGLLASFLEEGHIPWHGNRSVWGSAAAAETDLLRDIDGHGWHLDRTRFDAWLRAIAVGRGAHLLSPARVQCVERCDSSGRGWQVLLGVEGGVSVPVHA